MSGVAEITQFSFSLRQPAWCAAEVELSDVSGWCGTTANQRTVQGYAVEKGTYKDNKLPATNADCAATGGSSVCNNVPHPIQGIEQANDSNDRRNAIDQFYIRHI